MSGGCLLQPQAVNVPYRGHRDLLSMGKILLEKLLVAQPFMEPKHSLPFP